MKANLDYVIRPVTAPGEARPSLVPVIVNRIPSRPLSAVISNAIKNNLIAGLQPSAVGGIAAGLADQIYDTLCDGRGVRFGSFFYVRPYLTGQTDANGTLSREENGIDATIVAGPDFALTLGDFSLHFTGRDTQPKIDMVKYNAVGSDNGLVKKGEKTLVYGDLLVVSESDDAKVRFTPMDGASEPVEVTSFDAKGAQQLEFDCPAVLVAGGEYAVEVSRSDGDGNMRVSNTKRVKVLDGETPPTPVTTLTNVKSAGGEDGVVTDGTEVEFTGTNLGIDGSRLQVRVDNGSTPEDEFVNIDTAYLDAEHSTDTRLVASDGMWSSLHDSGIGETGQNLIWKYKGATIAATVG